MKAYFIFVLVLTVAYVVYYAIVIAKDLHGNNDKKKSDEEEFDVSEFNAEESVSVVENDKGFNVGDNEYVFRNYIIQTGRYSVYGIRVGDNISKVKAMGGMFKDVRDDDGGGCMYWAPSAKEGTVVNWDWICCPKFYYDPDGTINCLELWYS